MRKLRQVKEVRHFIKRGDRGEKDDTVQRGERDEKVRKRCECKERWKGFKQVSGEKIKRGKRTLTWHLHRPFRQARKSLCTGTVYVDDRNKKDTVVLPFRPEVWSCWRSWWRSCQRCFRGTLNYSTRTRECSGKVYLSLRENMESLPFLLKVASVPVPVLSKLLQPVCV